MTLAAGETLGPYEIVDTLGAGGMGTVYRAQDTRLNRPVAIKVVGGAFTGVRDGDALEREALDHAHRHGVLHRDLKPANIMLTRSGVKVLDFGLATLQSAAPMQVPLDRTPAVGHQITSESTLLGTVHYMAPERLEGRETTAVSDLFAFGA